MHILFTGIGRRIELVQAFRNAANVLGKELKIYGADMTGTAPALTFCDEIRYVCGMKEKEYISQLVSICAKDKIDLLVPTIDTDLLILAENVSKFNKVGTKVLISKPDKIAICRDKNYTANFFEKCGLKAPHTYNDYLKYADDYPCFIKPKDGSSSINAFKVNNREELAVYSQKIGDYIIQPFIDGTEYTIDIFCDFKGRPISIVPRERIQVRAGEVLKTKIRMDKQMISEAKSICYHFKPCGPLTVQLIRQKGSNDDYYIEINPRFGGGSPLSMKAGARSPEAILKMLDGETIPFCTDVEDDAIYSRFDQSVCISEGKSVIKGVIFDLDDTLYNEKDYVKSGFKTISDYLGGGYEEQLWSYFETGKPAIDELAIFLRREPEKNILLQLYRSHKPVIHLYNGVEELLSELRYKGYKIGIITDGRPEGQKNKIEALGLKKYVDDIIITDELGGTQFRKPNDISFRIMQNRWRIPFEQMVYVGDNPIKDFQAPNQLGLKSIFFMNSNGLYAKQNNYSTSTIYNIDDLRRWLNEYRLPK